MLRRLMVGLCALVVCAGVLIAAEIKGKIKSVDADKNSITVTVGDKDQTFMVPADAKITTAAGKDVPDRLKAKQFKAGREVTITTEKKGDKDVVTKIELAPAKKN
jgi:hypothetical protein